jgi:adenylate cyclase
MGTLQILAGNPTEALETFRSVRDANDRWVLLMGVAIAEHSLGHGQESKAALEELARDFGTTAAYQVAQVHAWRGEKDKAFEWLDRAYAQRDAGFVLLVTDPLMDGLRSDPRFKVLLRELKLPE